MDPALWELLRGSTDDREVEAIIRLDRPQVGVAGVRIVSRFGGIATCRLRKDSILEVRRDENVVSLKAARALGPEHLQEENGDTAWERRGRDGDPRRPPGLLLTGAGVTVGFVDWGCDVDHPNFKHRDGSTRLRALWDQRGPVARGAPQPYGYGVLHHRGQINRALRTADPYAALDYHPADADRDGSGAHGSHVMDIAAGNGSAGGPVGIAPEADLVFVHLAERGTSGLANLGDSVRILEAVDFIARTAGHRPWVINISVGRHGGPHDGCTLAELALDAVLRAAPGRFIVQSAGNYFASRTHASGRLEQGQLRSLTMVTHEADITPNELEIWYSGEDELMVRVGSPTGRQTDWVRLGETLDVVEDDLVVGRIYHRDRDPNNYDNHVELFLYPWAPAGPWDVDLQAGRIRDGAFHAWLERDEACAECQARFVEGDVDRACTTGTIANAHLPLVVGAYDAHAPDRPLARFSSAGPTRDGRLKPDLIAPGVGVLAARSAPPGSANSPGLLTRKSGTSMAAPHVTGAIALCLEAAPRPLTAEEIRTLVLSTADRVRSNSNRSSRLGRGYLDLDSVVAAVSSLGRGGNTSQREDEKGSEMQPGIEHASGVSLGPEKLYRELVYRRGGPVSAWVEARFDVLARPGEAPHTEPEAGDLLIRVRLGEPGAGYVAMLSDATLTPRQALAGANVGAEREGPGLYAVVSDGGASLHARSGRVARRILDGAGRMPLGQVLLRQKQSVKAEPDDELSSAMGGEADGGPEYERILDRLQKELALPFKDPDDPGLLRRRQRLRSLFTSVPPAHTRQLHDRLGERPTGDQLSRSFHGRLATATRLEMLEILRKRFPPAQPTAPQVAAPKPTDVWPHQPLPADAQTRFGWALRALKQKVAATTDPRAWRYACWLSKLEAGGDDRVIQWHRICPRKTGAIGAALVIGGCDITAGPAVDQMQLVAAIKSVQDIERANQQLEFMTYMRSKILFTYEMTSESVHLESFRRLHDEVGLAFDNLDLWANAPLGGSSAMPPAYVAIKDWIGARQRDATSVYSCK